MKKLLVTGAGGFIGKNLCATLEAIGNGTAPDVGFGSDFTVFAVHQNTPPELLEEYCAQADFVFHLAGVNRPEDPSEFAAGNCGFTQTLLAALQRHGSHAPVLFASSTQAALDNPYGRSKRAAEELVLAYAERTGTRQLVYRFPNVFGKWCRPNYNSVVATFCHNIARDLEIRVNDPAHCLTLLYIDDLIDEVLRAVSGNETRSGGFCQAPVTHTITLGALASTIRSFRSDRALANISAIEQPLTRKLYSTYLSYLPKDSFGAPLQPHCDQRGSFTELLHFDGRGQVSVNISKPGITKGNHWHHTKTEKFIVVAGSASICLRKVGEREVVEYTVCGQEPRAIDIPPGYTHSIANIGTDDLVTVMWASELFDPEHPDTYYLEV